ncbi:hypothetical protein HDR69_00395 [bacterium]|nr:hypothetical protein [bacterium]
MSKQNVTSISDARKSLNRNFMLNVHSGWAGTTEEFLITNICRSKIKGKIDIKGKKCHYVLAENDFNQLTRYGQIEIRETVDGCIFTNKVRLVVAPKPVKVVKITFFGGFHQSNEINAIIKESDFEDFKNGNIGIEEALSYSQLERLNRHFCGVEGCSCGGVRRASWYKA